MHLLQRKNWQHRKLPWEAAGFISWRRELINPHVPLTNDSGECPSSFLEAFLQRSSRELVKEANNTHKKLLGKFISEQAAGQVRVSPHSNQRGRFQSRVHGHDLQ